MIDLIAHWPRYALALSAHYSGLDLVYRRVTGAGLVVLMLHRLRDDYDPYPLSMSRQGLRELVGWLRRRHALVGLDEGLQHLADGDGARINYAITFDDGYQDNLGLIDAELGAVPAVVYVATDQIGGDPIWVYRLTQAVERRTRDHLDLGSLGLGHFDLSDPAERQRLYLLLPPRLKQFKPEELHACIDSVFAQTQPVAVPDEQREMLDWEEVRKLDAHGIRIGAHTRNHVLLSRVDEPTARDEIVESRERIARELGMPPRHFAYPNGGRGDFGDRDIQLARDAGFKTAATSIEGVNRLDTDPFQLLRYNVHEARFRSPSGNLSAALFFSETSGLLGWLRAWRSR